MSTQPAMTRFRRTDRPAFRVSLALLAAAGLALSAGCEQGEAPEEITNAQATLLSVSAGGLSAPTESRRRAYQSVVSQLQGVSGDYDGVAAETASALMGEAQAGLAQIEQAEAVERGSEVSALLSSARLAASEFANQSAIAAAMRQGDSGADLDRIAEEARQVAMQIEQAGIDREGIVAQVAQLNRRQQEQRAQADAIRRQEAEVRQEAIRADADRRAELTEQAYRLSRRAAEFERAGSDLQAQADVLLPEVRNAEIRERQYRTLAEQLETTRRAIEAERARRLEDAEAAQRVADRADERLAGVLSELEDALTTGFEPASDETIAAYERAVGTLRRANNRLALASAQQGLGGAHHLRATVFAQGAAMLDDLAALTPSPSSASRAGSLADDLAAKGDQAREDAASAYDYSAQSLSAAAANAKQQANAARQRASAISDSNSRIRADYERVAAELQSSADTILESVSALESLAGSLRGEAPADEQPGADDPALNEG